MFICGSKDSVIRFDVVPTIMQPATRSEYSTMCYAFYVEWLSIVGCAFKVKRPHNGQADWCKTQNFIVSFVYSQCCKPILEFDNIPP